VKRLLLSHLYLKTIILPRQARDIHRENSKKDTFPHQYYALDRGDDDHDNNDYLENCRATLDAGLGTVASVRSKGELDARRAQNTYLLCRFMLKTIILPGQARDKHRESALKEMRFIAGSACRCSGWRG